METKSIDRINTMHPKVRQKALDAYREAVKATPVGVHPFVDEGLRSFERSDALYAQGRTKPGNIVTNAKGGSSLHNYGLALDFHLQVNGKDVWPNNFRADKNWMKVVEIFKKHGFTWGGDFRSIVDAPHFEMTFGYTTKQLLALKQSGKIDKEGYVLI